MILDPVLLSVLLRRGQGVHSLKIRVGIPRENLVDYDANELREDRDRRKVQVHQATIAVVWVEGIEKLLVDAGVLRAVGVISVASKDVFLPRK